MIDARKEARAAAPHDGGPKKIVDKAGYAFIPTEAPLAFTLSWLHSAMPQIIRGRSVFAPYLIPNQKNLQYMAKRGYIKLSQEDLGANQSG